MQKRNLPTKRDCSTLNLRTARADCWYIYRDSGSRCTQILRCADSSIVFAPTDGEIQAVRDRFGEVQIGLARAFPRSRIVPIGSHSRGTAIAVHSHIDFLAVLPSEWAIWGARRMSPLKIIHRMMEYLGEFAPAISQDGRGVELYFNGVTCAVDVVPGFLVRAVDQYPVYSLPGEENQWIEASPEWHSALFSHANARSGAKLRSISQLVKIWQFAGSPPLGISGLYLDMMLATSDIAAGIKSYGQCLSDFFKELVRQEIRALPDPAGASGVIVASPSSDACERVYDAAKAAIEHAQAALDAQTHGDNAEANRHWEVIFKRRISRRRQIHYSLG